MPGLSQSISLESCNKTEYYDAVEESNLEMIEYNSCLLQMPGLSQSIFLESYNKTEYYDAVEESNLEMIEYNSLSIPDAGPFPVNLSREL